MYIIRTVYIYIYLSSIVIIELVSVFSCIAYNTIFDQASASSMALLACFQMTQRSSKPLRYKLVNPNNGIFRMLEILIFMF